MPKTTKIAVEIDVPEIVDSVIKQLSSDGTLVAVVRCKECKHYNDRYGNCPFQYTGDPYIECEPDDNFYCANGEVSDE